MSDIAIKVENLSKAYQLGDFGTGSLTQDIERWWALMRGKEDPFLTIGETNDRTSKGGSDVIWSLKDINFEIKEGDAVGIIGRNGAGKSTLLKILSRVTSPTTGNVKIKGRMASLLEVGTGFHPELTGGENIYLNGAIMGMNKRAIKRRFDEIVDFAGIERYVDTPVKRYSSGMYVRLAFAVAAHLESEILIVDEVLAVGDAEFQKKCLGKMDDVSKGEGRTVLFVSHQMNAITSFCSSAILLNKGLVEARSNDVKQIINLYLNNTSISSLYYWRANSVERLDNKYFTPVEFCLVDKAGKIVDRVIDNKEEVFVKITFDVKEYHTNLTFGYSVYDDDNQLLYSTYNIDAEETSFKDFNVGENIFFSPFPRRLLNEGRFRLELVSTLHNICWINALGGNDVSFNVEIKGSLSDSPLWLEKRTGIIAPVLKWKKLN